MLYMSVTTADWTGLCGQHDKMDRSRDGKSVGVPVMQLPFNLPRIIGNS